MKLNYKIVLLCSIAVCLALTSISTFQYLKLKKNTTNLLDQNIKELIMSVKKTINQELEEEIEIASYTAKIVEIDPDREFINTVINEPVLKNKFEIILFAFDDGRELVKSVSSWTPVAGYDPKTRPWYRGAIKNPQQPMITAPYPDSATGEIIVTVAISVIDQLTEKTVGVFCFDINLVGLSKVLNKVTFGGTGYAFLIDKNGTIISHPKSELNGKKMSEFLAEVKIKPTAQLITQNGKKTLLSFSKIDSQKWYLGVMIDPDKAFSSVNQLGYLTIALTITSLFSSILLIHFALTYLMAPLNDLIYEIGEQNFIDPNINELSSNDNIRSSKGKLQKEIDDVFS